MTLDQSQLEINQSVGTFEEISDGVTITGYLNASGMWYAFVKMDADLCITKDCDTALDCLNAAREIKFKKLSNISSGKNKNKKNYVHIFMDGFEKMPLILSIFLFPIVMALYVMALIMNTFNSIFHQGEK